MGTDKHLEGLFRHPGKRIILKLQLMEFSDGEINIKKNLLLPGLRNRVDGGVIYLGRKA